MQTQSWRIRLTTLAALASGLLSANVFAAEPNRNLAVSQPAAVAAQVAERRLALVIGNGAYDVSPLRNPVNDARAVASALRQSGFQVTEKHNLTQSAMREAIRVFGDQLRSGGVGLFYYAGHGMQVRGRNYLLPVKSDVKREDEVEDQAVSADLVLQKLDAAKNRLNIVILDACRNNPFASSFRSASRGLAQMDAPSGTLLAFATAPGSVAADGRGSNGLYTQHLVANIKQPGLRIEDVFKRVRVAVKRDSQGLQVPWENTSLEGDFYFKPGRPGEVPTQLASLAPALESEPAPGAAATGETWTEPTTGMEFVWVPKGCFQMGSPESENGRYSDERHHEACVDGYWMAKYEVTNSQYKKFRSDHGADDKLPVTKVRWQDAMHFAQWLSEKSGEKIRLPTEAEWEYAARAGTTTAYYWGDSWDGRHNYVSSEKKPVGSHQPNAFGLYDMLGNVWEWTASNYDSDYGGGERQVASLAVGGHRVARGGSWDSKPRDVRSADRDGLAPVNRGDALGFRLARSP